MKNKSLKSILIITLSHLLIITSLSAQSPQMMSYQAVIRNNTDQLLKNQIIGMRISILQGSASGTAVYVETQTPATNANGLVSIEIGEGTIVSGTFAGIDWSTGTYFVKTETDPAGGTGYSITGTSQILSVPYALYAKTSESSKDAVKLTGHQTIEGNKTFNGIVTGTLNANNTPVSNVANPVNPNDAVNKAYVDAMKQEIKLEIFAENGVSDIDGNIYLAVNIGTQVWMAENLKTTKYNDGTLIPYTTVDATWAAATIGFYTDCNNTPSNSTTYGRLYNWYAVDNNTGTKIASNGGKNVCPIGWHVPTDAEWTIVTDYLTSNGYGYQGSGDDISKSMAATTLWLTNSTAGTVGNDQASNNSSGFTALPAGHRYNYGAYGYFGYGGRWWSSSAYSTADSWSRLMLYSYAVVFRNYDTSKQHGFSVRCLRD